MKLIKKILKITLYVLGFAILIVQFIRPEKNASGSSNNNITTQFAVPAEVESMLKTSCYDCHSNTTTYPWYASVQPVGWWLADHIKDGKDELNFDEFASYSPRRQYKKFNEIVEQVTNDDMPLPSYLLAHRKAIFSPQQKTLFIIWNNTMLDSMRAKYPIDSLERKAQR